MIYLFFPYLDSTNDRNIINLRISFGQNKYYWLIEKYFSIVLLYLFTTLCHSDSLYISVYLSVCLSFYLSVYLSTCQSVNFSLSRHLSLSLFLSSFLSISIYLTLIFCFSPSLYLISIADVPLAFKGSLYSKG